MTSQHSELQDADFLGNLASPLDHYLSAKLQVSEILRQNHNHHLFSQHDKENLAIN